MTRPQMIRADTIDLQSPDAPSAKDHTRQPAHPRPLGDGPPAPHQAIALKHAEAEIEFHPRSPRHSQDLSNKELQLLHEDSDSFDSTSATLSERHGISNGTNGEEMDMGDGEGEDSLEDDMMDKISSSPSIEDGGYYSTLSWPSRGESLVSISTLKDDAAPPPPRHVNFSSSLFLSPHTRFPLSSPQKEVDLDPPKDDHRQGGYPERDGPDDPNEPDPEYHNHRNGEQHVGSFHEKFADLQDSYDANSDLSGFHQWLLSQKGSSPDNGFDNAPSTSPPSSSSSSSISSWDDGSPNGDDDTEVSFNDDSRFIDSGWGGECLRDTEDIDFDFVYALHTFFATVEGQANATKGDTMVLLDDSNSYWWLVRVVKDGSIGYLPAEHIETPTERLARLNKHRNIDLSQTMLGDNPEKPKNPLKKAMRRRNAKQVQFTAPTYYDASDVDYSTEEDEEGDGGYSAHEDENQEPQSQDQSKDSKEDATVDLSKGSLEIDANSIGESHISVESRDTDVDRRTLVNGERTSDESVERLDEGSNSRSKKGTVRNTDSFFKDDNLETRKINLTPSLLRDDSSESTIKSIDPKEVKTRASLDSLEKGQPPPERAKEEKKRKEKKGMLSGLFKRKDKKNKSQEEDTDESPLLGQSQQFKESLESLVPEEKQATKVARQQSQRPIPEETQATKGASQQPQRQSSKLQKPPPAKQPTSGKPPARSEPAPQKVSPVDQLLAEPQSDRTPSPAITQPEERVLSDGRKSPHRDRSAQLPRDEPEQPEPPEDTDHEMPPSHKSLSSSGSNSQTPTGTRPEMALSGRELPPSESEPEPFKKPKQGMPLDESNSSTDTEQPPNTPMTTKDPDPPMKVETPNERLSESPVQVDVPDRVHPQNTPLAIIDSSSHEDLHPSTHSPTSSAELIEAPHPNNHEDSPASTDESSRNTPTWSDASLRAYLEDGSDIRDLLILVNDISDVKPADPDHPMVKNLFHEERRQLREISDELDSLLMGFIARRSRVPNR